mgnify:FL=1
MLVMHGTHFVSEQNVHLAAQAQEFRNILKSFNRVVYFPRNLMEYEIIIIMKTIILSSLL